VSRAPSFTLHDFLPSHLPELVDLWVASWRQTMPTIDFEARRTWFVDRLSALQSRGAQVVCAFDSGGAMAGFVTVDQTTGLLDQIAVAPRYWGGAAAQLLLNEAKRRSPTQIWLEVNQDNPRAVRFYEKHEFAREGESVNPRSGLKTWRYRWRAHPVVPTGRERG
jgi:putative acetyltransferase